MATKPPSENWSAQLCRFSAHLRMTLELRYAHDFGRNDLHLGGICP